MWSKLNPAGNTCYSERFKDPLTGKPVIISVTLKGDKDTASKRRMALSELERKFEEKTKAAGQASLTLKEIFERYKAYQEQTVKASTRRRNNDVLNVVLRLLNPESIADNLTVGYVRDRLLEHTSNPVKLNGYITRFKAMMRWAFDSEYISNENVIRRLKKFKVDVSDESMRPEDKYLEPDQLEALLDYMKDSQEQWYLLTQFLVLSGLRIGEALALDKSDISDTEITVNKTFDVVNREVTTAKTAASNRQVYIQPELAEALKQIKRYHRNIDILTGTRSEALFHTDKGERLSYAAYSKYIRETTDKVLGERRTAHCFRHTHASLLFAEGMTIDQISRRLGHENSRITMKIYLHIVEKVKEKDREALKKITLLKKC